MIAMMPKTVKPAYIQRRTLEKVFLYFILAIITSTHEAIEEPPNNILRIPVIISVIV